MLLLLLLQVMALVKLVAPWKSWSDSSSRSSSLRNSRKIHWPPCMTRHSMSLIYQQMKKLILITPSARQCSILLNRQKCFLQEVISKIKPNISSYSSKDKTWHPSKECCNNNRLLRLKRVLAPSVNSNRFTTINSSRQAPAILNSNNSNKLSIRLLTGVRSTLTINHL